MSYASLQYEIFCRFICAGSLCDLKLFAVQVCHLEVLGCLGREFLKAGAGLRQPATANNHSAPVLSMSLLEKLQYCELWQLCCFFSFDNSGSYAVVWQTM
jgi:hypothetical protein